MNRQLIHSLFILIVLIVVVSFLVDRGVRAQDIDSSPSTPVAPDSMGVGFSDSELPFAMANPRVGFRSEQPGPFLNWPVPTSILRTKISMLPDSPWTKNFLGISDCPQFPPWVDDIVWGGVAYTGQFANYALPGTTRERVKFLNVDDVLPLGNYFACYRSTVNIGPDHAGTDISAPNGTFVLATAYADQVYVLKDDNGDYRVALRHPNVNGSGQTWYSNYVHLSSTVYPVGGPYSPSGGIQPGTQIGSVGQRHLHFQLSTGVGDIKQSYYSPYARNIWGIDQPPWSGCLWRDASLCAIPPSGSACCGCGSRVTSKVGPSGNGLFDVLGPPAPESSLIIDLMTLLDEPSIDWQWPELSQALSTEPIGLDEPQTEGTIPGSNNSLTLPQGNAADELQAKASMLEETEFGLPASANYQIVRSVKGMGGGLKSSSSYILAGTSGQAFATGLRTSASYQLRSGYWGASANSAVSTPTPTVAAPATITPTSIATATASPSATATVTVEGTQPPMVTPTSTVRPTATSTAESPTATATRPANLDFSLHLPVIMRE